MLDAPRRRHWTLSFFRDHAIASWAKVQPSLSAKAQTSLNLSEYFRAGGSSSAGFSFHSLPWIKNTVLNIPGFFKNIITTIVCQSTEQIRWNAPLCTKIGFHLLSNWTRNIYSENTKRLLTDVPRFKNRRQIHKLIKLKH